jgi:hypothetical protein
MKKVIGCIAAVVLISASLACAAEGMKEPAYRSTKPLYAAVVLDEAGTKVLTLAFDESAGTGKGYDTLYADVNVNGDLTDDKTMRGNRSGPRGSSSTCSFPFTMDVPYNEKSKGVEKPWEFYVDFHEYTPTKLFGLVRGQTQRYLSIGGKLRLKDEAGEWEYSFSSGLPPAETRDAASPIGFRGKPALRVMTQPDRQKEGNTGIAAYLTLDPIILSQCLKAGQPVKAHVLVKNEEGKTVHSEDVSHDKLTFG